jgi:hypothetical protein
MIRDIIRFIKLKRLSMGRGHPELVPIKGSQAYLRHSGRVGRYFRRHRDRQ